jgi:hypothetical protein
MVDELLKALVVAMVIFFIQGLVNGLITYFNVGALKNKIENLPEEKWVSLEYEQRQIGRSNERMGEYYLYFLSSLVLIGFFGC